MASERGIKCIASNSRFYICQQKLIHKPKFLPKSRLALINFPNLYKDAPNEPNLCRENYGTCDKANAYGQGIVILEEAKKQTRLAKCQRLFKDSHHSCLFTDLEGQILGANTAALETYGYTLKKLCGMKIYDLSPEESKDLVNKQLQEAYGSGITYETYQVRNNGECFPVEVNSFRIETMLVSIIQDITERKQLARDFLDSETIKVIGKVASGLAHEVRNSITSVHGFIQLVAGGIISQERFVENCEMMLLELNHVDRIISDLLLLASNRRVNLEKKNLNQIILAMIPSLEDVAKSQGKTIELQLEDIPDLLLDEYEFKYLIRILVDNALDSMGKGGKAWIMTHKKQKTFSLSIRDNGSGIKPEIIEKLGTPFVTTKDSGIGLGFVICKSIVMRQNATLEVESSNLGTMVQITFDI